MGSQSASRQRQSVQGASVDGGTVQFHGGESVAEPTEQAAPELERRRKAANELLALRGPEPCMRRTPPALAVAVLVAVVRTLLRTAPLALLVRVGLAIPVTPGLSWPAWLWGAEDPGGEGEGGYVSPTIDRLFRP